MDIEIKKYQSEEYHAPRPKLNEVAVPVRISKMIYYWKAISRWSLILFAGLMPIFFLPATQLPVAVHKELLAVVLIFAAFFALLGRILIEGRIRYPGHLIAAALAVLILVWGASSFFSINPLISSVGSWSTPDSFASIVLFALLALSIFVTFDRRDIILSLVLFLASLSLLGVFELFQLFKVFILPFDFTKNIIFNPVGSVNNLGALLAFGLVIASGLASASIPRIEESAEGEGKILGINSKMKKFLMLSVVILALNLIIIDFWAIWVGLALAMVFMISFLSAGLAKSEFRSPTSGDLEVGLREASDFTPGLQLVYFQKAWLPSIILLIALLFLFVPSPLAKFIQTPLEVSPNFNATMDIGIKNLKAGHYFLGSGPGTFSYLFNLYKPVGINQTIFWSTTFNTGISAMTTWLGTVGILGVLALLFLIAAFIWNGILAFRSPAPQLQGGLQYGTYSQLIFVAVIFMFAMWFLYAINFTTMAFAFWGIGLFLAMNRSGLTQIEADQRGNYQHESVGNPRKSAFREIRVFTSPPKTFIFSLLIVGLMVGAVVGIYFEINRYIAELYFSKALKTSSGQANYASAIQFWPYDERYFQGLSQAVFLELNDLLQKKDLPQEELRSRFQNITTDSIAAAKKAGELNSQNPFNTMLLGGIYENLIPFVADAANFALSSYGAAISLDPKNPANYLALARVEVAKNELDKAVANLEKAIDLKADYAPARFLLVQIFDQQGKLNDAIKRAEELVVLNNQDVGSLFQLGFLYYKAGRYDDSKMVFERTVQLSPNYSNARYFLGLIYDGSTSLTTSEKKAKALEQFAKISELNPDNDEIKLILKNLKAGKAALFGIAPPAPAPQNRAEVPVSEGAKAPVKPLKK